MPEELTAWLTYAERTFIVRVYRSLSGWTEEITEELPDGTVAEWPASEIGHATARDALIFALTCVIDTVDDPHA